jgi:transposase
MGHLSAAAKEAIVLKAINRGAETLDSVAKTNNVGLSSLQKWLRRYREGQPLPSDKDAPSGKLSRAEKFQHILATASLDDVSLGKYCREHGLYSHELKQWQELLMLEPKIDKDQRVDLKQLKAENKQLKKELRRKEKALAEASALLVMKKKADLIWGDAEED